MSHKSSISSDTVFSFKVLDKWKVCKERREMRTRREQLGDGKYLNYLISHVDEETVELLASIEDLNQSIMQVIVAIQS